MKMFICGSNTEVMDCPGCEWVMSVALSISWNGVTHFLDMLASNSRVIWIFSSNDLTVKEGPILVNRVVT